MVTELATQELARARAARIRGGGGPTGMSSYAATLALIADAWKQEHWKALGYESWNAYVEAEFSADRLRISPVEHAKVATTFFPPTVDPGQARPDVRAVYFLQARAGGLIKIGVATSVTSRFGDIQRMCPIPLAILATIPTAGQALETELHQRFAFARRHGEWFEPVTELLAYIAENGVRP